MSCGCRMCARCRTAARFDINGKMADLLDFSFGWRTGIRISGYISHDAGRLNGQPRQRQHDRSYNYNCRLISVSFCRDPGMPLSDRFSYNKTTQLPVLRNASDIVLPRKSGRRRNQSRLQELPGLRKLRQEGFQPLFTVLLNRQKLNFSYVRTQSLSVSRPYSFGENFSVGGQFNMTY